MSADTDRAMAAIAAIRRSASWADYADAHAVLDVAEAGVTLSVAVNVWCATMDHDDYVAATMALLDARDVYRATLARLAEVAP